jgi:hypothetical protein
MREHNDNELTEALNKVSELQKEKPATRKKSVNTDRDAGTY